MFDDESVAEADATAIAAAWLSLTGEELRQVVPELGSSSVGFRGPTALAPGGSVPSYETVARLYGERDPKGPKLPAWQWRTSKGPGY